MSKTRKSGYLTARKDAVERRTVSGLFRFDDYTVSGVLSEEDHAKWTKYNFSRLVDPFEFALLVSELRVFRFQYVSKDAFKVVSQRELTAEEIEEVTQIWINCPKAES